MPLLSFVTAPDVSPAPAGTGRLRRGGVSLLELVITVLVIGIMVSTGVPKYAAQLHNRQLHSATQRLTADLESLRVRALTTSSVQTVVFDAKSHSYSLRTPQAQGAALSDRTVRLNESPWHTHIDHLYVGSDPSDRSQLTISFNGMGRISSDFRVSLSSGQAVAVLTMNRDTGRITVE